jgi:hypothetical protein
MTDDAGTSTGGASAPAQEPTGSAPTAPEDEAATPATPATSGASPEAADRAADLVLAGVHLRLGSLALARAELETLAGRDALDSAGILDLAEARWRTGDVEGAGEAAAVLLEDEEGPLLALVVAAEAAAARGRPTEARRLAAKALTAANGSIDRVFAGMPRSPAWPPDPASPPPAPTTMFDPPHGGAARRDRRQPARRVAGSTPDGSAPTAPADAKPAAPAPAPGAEATIGLWGDETDSPGSGDAALPNASEALDQGRAALEAGDLGEAAIQLALVLRLSSPLAPAVLDLVADRSERELAFVRGDAYRLVGRELDARRAYARAGPAGPTSTPPATSGVDPSQSNESDHDHPQEGDPA